MNPTSRYFKRPIKRHIWPYKGQPHSYAEWDTVDNRIWRVDYKLRSRMYTIYQRENTPSEELFRRGYKEIVSKWLAVDDGL